MEKNLFGWFRSETQEKLLELIEEHDIKTVIEVGSFVGKATAFFAKHCDHVFAVDTFKMWPEGMENGDAQQFGYDFYEQFLFNMRDEGVLDKITPVRMTSREAAEEVFNTPVDLIYIDASHDYESVKEDIGLWAPFAGKIICGDDYDENWPGVKKAVDEFFYPHAQAYGNFWFAPIIEE